jgi:hypothetical protein
MISCGASDNREYTTKHILDMDHENPGKEEREKRTLMREHISGGNTAKVKGRRWPKESHRSTPDER